MILYDIRKIIGKEVENFQQYIDEGYFDYDPQKDMTLGYVNQSAAEVIAQIKDWDFSPLDNLIWHYARITLLEELFRADAEIVKHKEDDND